ncbi:hypothetical protein HHI36_023371 [Cryptolaemus montrouzieri]|uniref:Uncharacterized protein n=1 Tax=Cryptolaemus montrouzieri TaxID=559131 RepID=A0ABD2PGX5_9CUCU
MQKKRLVYNAVFESILLYAAPAWRKVLEKNIRINSDSVRGKCMGYRTVSYFSACVIAGIIPIELLVEERALSYRNNKGHQEMGDNGRSSCRSEVIPNGCRTAV